MWKRVKRWLFDREIARKKQARMLLDSRYRQGSISNITHTQSTIRLNVEIDRLQRQMDLI